MKLNYVVRRKEAG